MVVLSPGFRRNRAPSLPLPPNPSTWHSLLPLDRHSGTPMPSHSLDNRYPSTSKQTIPQASTLQKPLSTILERSTSMLFTTLQENNSSASPLPSVMSLPLKIQHTS